MHDEPLDFSVTYQTLYLEPLAAELSPRLKERLRALGRIERSLRTTNNYQRTKLTPLGDKQAELWIAEVNGVPGWFVGMIDAASRHIGLRGQRIDVVGDDGRAATFRLTWD